MELVVRHFWIVLVGVTVANGFIWRRRVQPRIDGDPALEPGYRRLFVGYMVWFNLPWVLMGVGILSGQVQWIFEFLAPRGGNPFVLAWWGALAAILFLGTVWVWGFGGAEMLERHPGVYMVPPWSARSLRWAWLGAVAWNLAIAALLFSGFPWADSEKQLEPVDASWLWVLFPVFFIAMSLLVSFLLSAMGGWRSLASRYATPSPFVGRKFRLRSAQFGGLANYGGSVTFGSSRAGLYLAVVPFLRFGHPPLLIPWSDLSMRKSRNWLFPSVEFEARGAPAVSFRVSRRLAEALVGEAGGEALVRFGDS